MDMKKFRLNFKGQTLVLPVLSGLDVVKGMRGQSEGSCILNESSTYDIDTLFMKYPLDMIWFDKYGIVRKVIKDIKPWKWIWTPTKSCYIMELDARKNYILPNQGEVIDFISEG